MVVNSIPKSGWYQVYTPKQYFKRIPVFTISYD